MKDIGTSIEGKILVEMEQEEYSQFSMLCQAVEGTRFPDTFHLRNHTQINFDFTKTFEVIRAFYSAHYRVSELESLINSIRESLNK